MITRQTVIDQIEACRSGELRIRLGLLLVEDGVEIDCKWHRTSITKDTDPLIQMLAVNSSLATMVPPMPPLPDSEIQRIEAFFKFHGGQTE